jgi:cytochrome oxidase Cu insertion factor (SCO1/SenC/PrrC family)
MNLRSALAMSCVLVVLVGVLHADVESGPAAGSKVEPLKVLVATGDSAGKELDYATLRKDKPTIFAFVQADKFDRPVARFLKTLDDELAKKRDDVHIVAVWLTEDKDKAKERLPAVQQSLKLAQTTFTIFQGDKSGPQGWSVNSDAHITAIVVHDNKVEASVGFVSVNETDVPAVTKKLKPKK